MSHNDKIKDMDAFFEVNPITRQIVNKTPTKIVLMQTDHDSERFTFSLPRYIEGHDMAESAKAELHYINASKNVKGMYTMKDLKVDPDNPDNVICSWLISGNATKEAGTLHFLIKMKCYEGDVLVYSWSTEPHKGISVGETFDNAEEIATQYADVLQQWEQRLFGELGNIKEDITKLDRVVAEIIENGGGSGEGEEGASDTDELFELQCGKNILIPDSESGYWDGTTPKTSSNHIRTPNPIPLESGHSLLTLTTDLTVGNSSNLFCVIWLDETGNSIRATSKSTQTTVTQNDGRTAFEIPTNATAFLAWLSGVKTSGDTLANFSLQYDNHANATFIQYVPPETVIKKQHLPYGVQPLYGKTIVNFGDSIFGNYQFPNDISTEIAKLTGATVHNCGFGGCQMSEHQSEDYKPFSMYKLADAITTGDFTTQDEKANGTVVPSYFKSHVDLLKSIDFTDVDIVTIAYGTNDFTAGDDLENADNNKDTTKFAGALRYSIETLLNAYPHLKIFVCSQTYRFWYDDSGDFSEDSDTRTTSGGLKLTDFVEKTKEVAEEYHLPFVNNYNIGMNKYNRSVYFSSTDGTHPILFGRHLIASHIAKELF